MSDKIKPSLNRVVVKRDEAATQTASGLYIPDTEQDKPQEGTVVAVGPGSKYFHDGQMVTIPVEFNPGDRVLFPKFGGTELKVDGEEVVMFNETEILGRLL